MTNTPDYMQTTAPPFPGGIGELRHVVEAEREAAPIIAAAKRKAQEEHNAWYANLVKWLRENQR